MLVIRQVPILCAVLVAGCGTDSKSSGSSHSGHVPADAAAGGSPSNGGSGGVAEEARDGASRRDGRVGGGRDSAVHGVDGSDARPNDAACSGSCPELGFRVAGNTFTKDGRPFHPHGFNMIGILSPDGCASPPGAGVKARQSFGQTELEAAKTAWSANTLRFQVSQRGLDPTDSIFASTYVDRIVKGVGLARSLDFVVIVSMQDQSIGCGPAHPLPSSATMRAWTTLAPRLASDPDVAFELFNEPQNQEGSADWQQWKEGGSTPLSNLGDDVVGHQQLADHLRALSVGNVLIADGANHAGKLQGVPLLVDGLSPPQIAYAIHPYFFHIADNSTLGTDSANWDMRFGYLAAQVPVIATEWNAGASCFAGQATRIPEFFAYLKAKDIGLLGHAFDVSGTMVQDLVSWTPTAFTGCNVTGSDAGALVQSYFASL